MNLLLVEDNLTIVKGLKYNLESNGYNIVVKNNIKDSIEYINSNNITNLIILDLSLPDGNGLNFYKEHIKDIPTIFLTAVDDEDVVVECLELGADDYITKPFSTKELLARIKKILLKSNKKSVIQVDNIKFDLDKMTVYKDNDKIELSSLELKILNYLLLNINKVVSRNILLDKIWEWTGNDVDDHTITVYIKRIREKIDSDIIKTVKGIGYRIDNE